MISGKEPDRSCTHQSVPGKWKACTLLHHCHSLCGHSHRSHTCMLSEKCVFFLICPEGNIKLTAVIYERESRAAPRTMWLWWGLSRQATRTNPSNPWRLHSTALCDHHRRTPLTLPLLPLGAVVSALYRRRDITTGHRQILLVMTESSRYTGQLCFQVLVGIQLETHKGQSQESVILWAQMCWINHFSQT